MKRLVGCVVCLLSLMTALSGQKSVDALFEKYSGREGFVALTLSGDLIKLAKLDDCEIEGCRFPADIQEIRLLVEDKKGSGGENFYSSVIKDINVRNYEELLRVKESDQDIQMLMKTDGNIIRELLLLAGGKDNFVIQLKGNMTMKEARMFSDDIKRKNE